VPCSTRAAHHDDEVGCFVNTLPLRCDAGGTAGFDERCAAASDRLFTALAHRDVPFAELIRLARADGQPLTVDVMFQAEDVRLAAVRFGTAGAEALNVSAPGAKFEVAACVREHDDGFALSIEYADDRLTTGHAAALADAMLTALGHEP